MYPRNLPIFCCAIGFFMQHLLRYVHSGNEVTRFNGDAAVFVLKKESGTKLAEKMMICRLV